MASVILERLYSVLTRFSWRDIIDIAVVTFIAYKLIVIIRGSRAEQLIKGVVFILLASLVSRALGFNTINWLITQLMTVALVAIPVVFQPELRRGLEQLGRGRFFARSGYIYGDSKDFETMQKEVLKAVNVFVKKRIGMLLVMERQTGLKEYIETGIAINGKVSAELLINIFIPHSPLHDGAVILQGSQVVAAGCYLPLTENPNLSKELGTRHRAALGLTEHSDAVAIIVSEETGVVSMAVGGKLTRYLDEKTLKQMLLELFEPETNPFQQFWQWRSS